MKSHPRQRPLARYGKYRSFAFKTGLEISIISKSTWLWGVEAKADLNLLSGDREKERRFTICWTSLSHSGTNNFRGLLSVGKIFGFVTYFMMARWRRWLCIRFRMLTFRNDTLGGNVVSIALTRNYHFDHSEIQTLCYQWDLNRLGYLMILPCGAFTLIHSVRLPWTSGTGGNDQKTDRNSDGLNIRLRFETLSTLDQAISLKSILQCG